MTSHNLGIQVGSSNLDGVPSELEGATMREHSVHLQEDGPSDKRSQGQATANMLPDNALLEIFDFYRSDPMNRTSFTWRWKTLTQVCRRWRHIIFASPRRLDLRLVCTTSTRTRKLLDIWPPFPITLTCIPWRTGPNVDKKKVENLLAAVERRDRISQIQINGITGSALKKLVSIMRKPFPALTYLFISPEDESVLPALPDRFLGGSAPRLEVLVLNRIPFPSFPKFILSATHIVHVELSNISYSGYIPPEAMATCLATLPDLKSLILGFRSRRSPPVQTSPPPLMRAVLPALTLLSFNGVSEYFEDFVVRIDTPLLKTLLVAFFMVPIFDIPRLRDYIDRTESLRPLNQAVIEFTGREIILILEQQARFVLQIKCEFERPDWQLLSMNQIFSQQLPLLSHVEQLKIVAPRWASSKWKDVIDMDPRLWLELFNLFIAVQSLYVSKNMALLVAAALQRPGHRWAMGVFPVLRSLFIRSSEVLQKGYNSITMFVAARLLLSDHPVALHDWDR